MLTFANNNQTRNSQPNHGVGDRRGAPVTFLESLTHSAQIEHIERYVYQNNPASYGESTKGKLEHRSQGDTILFTLLPGGNKLDASPVYSWQLLSAQLLS